MCGLKSFWLYLLINFYSSLPSWECGLKYVKHYIKGEWNSHSLRGSVDWNRKWWNLRCSRRPSLPSWECGLKYNRHGCKKRVHGHSLRGSVDWNISFKPYLMCVVSHSLRGSVDWNKPIYLTWEVGTRHSLRGSVDWNKNFGANSIKKYASLPSWECGLKFHYLP